MWNEYFALRTLTGIGGSSSTDNLLRPLIILFWLQLALSAFSSWMDGRANFPYVLQDFVPLGAAVLLLLLNPSLMA